MTHQQSIAKHLGVAWSLLWRATVLGPVFFVLSIGVIVSWMGLFFFPVLVGLNIYVRDWPVAAVFLGAWIFSVWLWRSRWFHKLLG